MWISERCLTCFRWAWRANSSATWLCPNRLISVDFSSSRVVWKVLPKGSKKQTQKPEKSQFGADTVQECHRSLSEHKQQSWRALCTTWPNWSAARSNQAQYTIWTQVEWLKSLSHSRELGLQHRKLLTDFRNSWSCAWENSLSNRPEYME